MKGTRRDGRSMRSQSRIQGSLKVGLALLALFVVGAMSAGALAEGGAFSALGALTGVTDDGASAPLSDDSAPSADSSSPAADESSASAPTPDAYIVTFVRGTTDAAAQATLAAAGATVHSRIAPLRMYSVTLAAADVDALTADPRVARVEQDLPRDVAGTPDDTDYPSQWALPRIGWEDVYGNVTPTGSAKVAVLDTGVDASDPDLDAAGLVVPGTSVLDGSDGRADPNGHGTAMAGIVAAETGNGAGIAGVAYAGVSVMPVTVLGADGTGQDSDVIQGVVYAADHGADVILMSFSNPGFSESLQDAIDYAWDKGAVLVAATGNDGSSAPTFPAGDRGVIGVASTDANDLLSPTSNYGSAAFLAAPGDGIASVNGTVTGTSASAAIVAGAAALMKASSLGATNGVIVSRLARNADAAGTTAETGNGRVNLARAIADASTDSIQPAGAAPVGGGGPFVGPYVIAAINGQLQSQSNPSCTSGGGCVGSGPWQTSKVTGWAELDNVPARVFLTKTNASPATQSQQFIVQFDHTKTQGGVPIPGIQNLTNFTASGAATITVAPVLALPRTRISGRTHSRFR
jgi:subtilisin family serine protease